MKAPYPQTVRFPKPHRTLLARVLLYYTFEGFIVESIVQGVIKNLADQFELAIDVTDEERRSVIRDRVLGEEIQPELVSPCDVLCPLEYRRFGDIEAKSVFRSRLTDALRTAWARAAGDRFSVELADWFLELALTVEHDGAIVFGDMISRSAFEALVASYDRVMADTGSESLLHAYVDLRNHPEFLSSEAFSDAFLHPLAVALIAHRAGGAVRVVDARGKDAQPLTVRAQDNMLHIDNTPFNDEFKVILTWEKGKASGPKGQNFVFLPGTHKGARNCFVNAEGLAWSSENASIFITDDSIEKVFAFQRQVCAGVASVVEVHDPHRPLTTVFAAGSLVHHRYRTEAGHARSCIIVAFHPAADNPGAFVDQNAASIGRPLHQALFLRQEEAERAFMEAITASASDIANKLREIKSGGTGTSLIDNDKKVLSTTEVLEWKKAAASAPAIEDLKLHHRTFPHGEMLTADRFAREVGPSMMLYDKHGPLDLILYEDNHEESRKWARNRIREMRLDRMRDRLRPWMPELRQPTLPDILTVDELADAADRLTDYIDSITEIQRQSGYVDPWDRISPRSAYRSLRQLATDLGEAIRRCYSPQNFLSTSLFLFWVYDETIRLGSIRDETLESRGGCLLRHYIATTILIHEGDAQ